MAECEAKRRHCLIWSHDHRAWWRAGGAGYTTDLSEAGVFGYEDAAKRFDSAKGDYPIPMSLARLLLAREVDGLRGRCAKLDNMLALG